MVGEGVLGGQRRDGAGQAEGPAASHLDPLERPSLNISALCGDRPSRPGRAAGGAPRPIPGGLARGDGPAWPRLPGGGGERQLAGALGGGRRVEARRPSNGDAGTGASRGQPTLNAGVGAGRHPLTEGVAGQRPARD